MALLLVLMLCLSALPGYAVAETAQSGELAAQAANETPFEAITTVAGGIATVRIVTKEAMTYYNASVGVDLTSLPTGVTIGSAAVGTGASEWIPGLR